MDLPMPATRLLSCSSDKHLLATCLDGSVVLYHLQDLAPHGRWVLHGMQPKQAGLAAAVMPLSAPGGCTAAELIIDGGALLLTAGADGLVNVLEMVTASAAASIAAASKRAAARPHKSSGAVTPSPMSRVQSIALLTPEAGPSPGMGGAGFKSWNHLGVTEVLSDGGPPPLDTFVRMTKALTWTEARLQGQTLAKLHVVQRFQV